MANGADIADQYERAAGYIDDIFKGEKPIGLPVQAPISGDQSRPDVFVWDATLRRTISI